MQLSPPGILSGIVKHYLIVESEKEMQLNYRLFTDGNPGIVFQFKTHLAQYNQNHSAASVQPTSFLYGQITNYTDLMSTGKLGMLVVVLQPYSIYALLGIAACELNNLIIKLSDLFGNEALALEEHILNEQSIYRIKEHAEAFLIKKLGHISSLSTSFKEALHVIYNRKGIITVEEVLKETHVTERQLERKFREYVGTSPKKFCDIVRFHHFLKLLRTNTYTEKISGVVYDTGYYDQSHLNNYFKTVTGITPTQYKLRQQLLAANFMLL